MKTNLLPAIRLTAALLVFFCVVYPAFIWGIAKVAAPNNGEGKIINYSKGNAGYGFANVGQKFTDDKYFWSRPSAVDYNAAGSGGSNKGPSNPDYLQTVKDRIDTFLVHNPGVKRSEIPADLVTASGAGLDPHISVQGAKVQVARIARIRGISEEQVNALVDKHIEKPLLGMFGTERVNVLELNIDLNSLNK